MCQKVILSIQLSERRGYSTTYIYHDILYAAVQIICQYTLAMRHIYRYIYTCMTVEHKADIQDTGAALDGIRAYDDNLVSRPPIPNTCYHVHIPLISCAFPNVHSMMTRFLDPRSQAVRYRYRVYT